VQVNVTNVIPPPSKLLLALEGGRASLEQAIEGALGRIPEASHHIRKLWATTNGLDLVASVSPGAPGLGASRPSI
jgi:hypothetical protein